MQGRQLASASLHEGVRAQVGERLVRLLQAGDGRRSMTEPAQAAAVVEVQQGDLERHGRRRPDRTGPREGLLRPSLITHGRGQVAAASGARAHRGSRSAVGDGGIELVEGTFGVVKPPEAYEGVCFEHPPIRHTR